MNLVSLLRYNFRILMLNNWWLLVFPIAVTQLSVFWNVVTQRFSMVLPAQSVEMITPLLAAFLGSHLLSAEYRSRVGAVLASRPVNINKVVAMRLVVMLAVVWMLAYVSLQAFAIWMEPYNTELVYRACVPSTLFLTMLALTFATIFRNSLVGFGLAALYWLLDMPPGAPLNYFLSLQSLTSHYAAFSDPSKRLLTENWALSKYVLSAAAVLLYLYHSRLVFQLGSAQTNRTRRRALLLYAAVLAFYVVSGAVHKVQFGYANRGHLAGIDEEGKVVSSESDLVWFRYQFQSYGPLPVSSLFGSAFPKYLGEFANPWRAAEEESDRMGDTVKHRRDLKTILDKMGNSPWAPSAADAYARLEVRRMTKLEDQVGLFQAIVDRFPDSPYVEHALRTMAIRYSEAGRREDAQKAYAELLKRVPNSQFRREAERFLAPPESSGPS